MRLDAALVARGLAPSRSAAAKLISEGAVKVGFGDTLSVQTKASFALSDAHTVKIVENATLRYVSRGGLKLEAALAVAKLNPSGLHVLDLGQSTGGFTDCLLQHGAAKVTGLEVGHGQLAAALKNDSRIICLEGVNVRHTKLNDLIALNATPSAAPSEGFALAVGDVSFISQTLLYPALFDCLAPCGQALLLVKPQFECQPSDLGKGGIVRNAALYDGVKTKIYAAAQAQGFTVNTYFASALQGGDGNHEFWVLLQK